MIFPWENFLFPIFSENPIKPIGLLSPTVTHTMKSEVVSHKFQFGEEFAVWLEFYPNGDKRQKGDDHGGGKKHKQIKSENMKIKKKERKKRSSRKRKLRVCDYWKPLFFLSLAFSLKKKKLKMKSFSFLPI